jgi:hypothetical protein
VAVRLLGEGSEETSDQKAEEERELDSLIRERVRAEIDRLKAETSLIEDIGALFKGMASQVEAHADVAICKKEQVERESADQDVRRLLLERRKSEIELEIARNRGEAKRLKERTERPEHQGRGPHQKNRNPQRQAGVPQIPVQGQGKEVSVDQRGDSTLKGPIKGLEKIPTAASS